jgi:hypothetical protein
MAALKNIAVHANCTRQSNKEATFHPPRPTATGLVGISWSPLPPPPPPRGSQFDFPEERPVLLMSSEPVFVNLFKEPKESIPSLAGRYNNPICRTGLPGNIGWRNRFLSCLNVYKYGFSSGSKTGSRVP